MNPSELRMMWMSQYNPDRLSLEDGTSYFSHPSVGLSVMEDISQQDNTMDMNPMMSVVGGEYNGQGTTSPVVTSATLRVQPTTALIAAPNANDLYGISQVGGIHQILQQSSAFQGYPEMIDQDESIEHPSTHYVTQVFDPIGESRDDDEIAGLTSKQEIINIDDFVMMTDSNSFDGTEHIIGVGDIKSEPTDKGAIAPHKSRNQRKSRKIEPVSRPGLVLKTPIAYKGNIDPSVIPIQKDGMAVCERCGAIGVKHTFYTKSRRFCSMSCARGELFSLVCNKMIGSTGSVTIPTTTLASATTASLSDESLINSINHQRSDIELALRVSHIKSPNSNYRFKITNQSLTNLNDNELMDVPDEIAAQVDSDENLNQKNFMYRDAIPQNDLPQIPKYERLPSPCPQSERICSVRRRQGDPLHSYDWTQRLSQSDFYVAPVTCFPHAPGYDVWDNIGIDMKVEVENTDCDSQEVVQPGQTPHSFWVATILNICGYKALMRYEGFDEPSHDFWVNLCSSEVHSVGWCATRGKPLIPPRTIESKYSDWKDFLVERLSGARTLPSSFYNKISDSMNSRFRLGLNLECVDKDKISQVKLATVNKIVGKRLFVKYFDSDDGFWCHEDSPIIHPVGWATTVGHNLAAPQDYLERMLAGREQMIEVHDDDATIELFKMNFTFEEYYIDGKKNGFIEGMKLEAVDPLNLSAICAATVMAVLKFGYMMIRIDSYQPDATGSDWFCYHEKSPSIFPVGFCETHSICLTPPNGYDPNTFSWTTYLKETQSIAAGEHLFHRIVPNHGFELGMSLECADLMDPRLVCVATVARVVGRLLKIHFDGWTDEYDQWLDCESPDVYPVGWCVLVNHKLEGPPMHSKITLKMPVKTKHKKKRKKICKPDNSFGGKNFTRPVNIKREAQDNQCGDRNFSSERLGIKLEMKSEPLYYDDEVDEEELEDDELRHSNRSTPLPISPELSERSNISTNEIALNINQNSNSPAPPIERKATSYIGNSTVSNSKYIPRLIDLAQDPMCSQASGELMPETWNVYDVSQFLRVNDCIAHCDVFSRNKIDGRLLLHLSKDEIITLLGMKVGPALKIFDLIQQLKCKLNPSKSRLLRANKLFL
ncbi:polycomb protein Sfmbt isoform X1 [Eupeodes corollae]|uniref:polycomb protein Sfmbt isoform X1 n=2 Tax=Eupeodes corollae TaxID=290404 RepID=UPI002492075A|nr:polycomb protein Sfmbt isoform X1 [Eupeodes corollae]